MKIKHKSIITAFIIIALFTSCIDKQATKDVQSDKNYLVDTTVIINGLETKITVEKKEDNSNKIIVSDELDAGNSKVVENTESKFTHYSIEYLVSLEDKNGKSKSSINLDLLSELNKSSKLENEIGNLKGQIISDGILFDGVAQDELLIFKLHTWDGGEGGGEWTIGVVKDKNVTIEKAPCVLMAFDREVGEDYHYKNNKFYIGQFFGSWLLTSDDGNVEVFIDEKGISYNESNNIFLNLRYELDKDDSNKILLFLKYDDGTPFGEFSAVVGSWAWGDFSREKPVSELIYNPKNEKSLIMNWFGFYNQKSNKYEWGNGADVKHNTVLSKN